MLQAVRFQVAVSALCAAFLTSGHAHAGETWDGGGANNNWTTALNWNSDGPGRDSAPDNDGTADIVMAGTTRLTPRVDVDWDINSLTFNSTAGGFSISGDPGVSLGIGAGGITNNDTQTQILLLPIGLDASQTWNAAAGPLSIGNTVAGHPLLTRTLTLDGANNINIAGAITTGITLNKSGTGTLTFDGGNTNSYTGTTTVSAGTLALGRTGGPNRAIPGNLIIGDGTSGVGADIVRLDAADQIAEAAGRTVTVSSSGLLNLNGFNETLQNLSFNGGTVSGAGTLIVNGAISSDASSTNASITGGTLDLNAATKTITVADGAATMDLEISSTITNGSLTKEGAGTLMLSGTTSTNVTTATINAGTLLINKSGSGNVMSTTGILGELGASDGSVTVTGAGSTWSNSGSVYVGGSATIDGGNGTLAITNQGLVDIGGTLKLWPGGNVALDGGTLETAVMQLAGGSFNWTSGTLRLSSDLSVDPAGLLGDSVAVGAGKILETDGELYVGNAGNGTLDITNGGRVSNRDAYVGDEGQFTATVTIDGVGSVWHNDTLNIGNGTLNVTNGASVTGVPAGTTAPALSVVGNGAVTVSGGGSLVTGITESYIAAPTDSSGSIVVTGPTSLWNSYNLLVGGSGTSTLEVTDHGLAQSTGWVVLGSNPGGEGNVLIDGPESRWLLHGTAASTPYTLIVGWQGEGAAQVMNGALLSVNLGDSYLGYGAGSGSVTVSGTDSSWMMSGDLYVGYAGTGTLNIADGASVSCINGYIGQLVTSSGQVNVDGSGSNWLIGEQLVVNRGTLTLTDDANVEADDVIVASMGSLYGDGDVEGNVRNGGTVAPGTSVGVLNIDGDYTQTVDGELLIELASASSYDRLPITSDAMLAGTLTVSLIDGYVPSPGQSFMILTADDIDGTFDTEVFPTVPNLVFDVIYNLQSVVLTVSAVGVPGDYNGDGTVDAADYVVWRKSNGTQQGYDNWRANFGASNRGGSLAAIPEPVSFAMLMIGVSVVFTRRRTAVSLNS